MSDLIKTKKQLIDELNNIRNKLQESELSKKNDSTADTNVIPTKEMILKGETNSRQILQTIPSGLIIVDLNKKITYANKKFEKIVGLKSEQIIGKECLLSFGCAQCKDGCELFDAKVTKPLYEKTCVIHVNGKEKTLLKNVEVLKDSEGNIIGGMESFNDVTEQKQAEKSVKESEKRYISLFETMAQGIICQDSKGKIINANPAAERIFGLSLDEMKGKSFVNTQWKIIHEDGTKFPFENHPSMVALKTGKEVYDTRMGVFNPIENRYHWLDISAAPQFRLGDVKPHQVYCTINDITERVNAKILLREERDRAQKYLDVAGVMFVAIDAKGIVTLINQKGCEILGYDQNEIIGKNWFDHFLPEKNRVEVKKVFNQLMKGIIEPVEYFENSILNKNSEEKIIAWHNTILKDDNSNISGTLSSGEDVTERILVQKQLTKQTEILKDTQQRARLGGWEYDVINNTNFWTDEVYSIYGVSKDFNINNLKEIASFFHSDDREIVVESFQSSMEKGIPYDLEVRFINAGGENLWVRTMGLPVREDGKVVKIRGNFQDITERKLAEETLIQSQEESKFLAHLLNKSSQPFAVSLPDGKLIKVNPAFCELVGYSEEEILKHVSWNETLTPREWRKYESEKIQQLIDTGESQCYEKEYIHKNGSRIPIELFLNRVIDEENNIEYRFGSITDITLRKNAEERIQQDLNEKRILLREIHHRVKNNMQIITSLINLQARNIKDKQTKDFLNECKARIRSMAMVHEQLYVSNNLARIDCTKYLKNLVDNLYNSYGINSRQVSVDVNITNIPIGIDQAIPCGLIVNELISNSFKYAFQKSKNESGKISISCNVKKTNILQLTVSDNGIGIPANIDIDNINTLGLHLVKILVEDQLHGTLKIRRNRGTRFLMEFPIDYNKKWI